MNSFLRNGVMLKARKSISVLWILVKRDHPCIPRSTWLERRTRQMADVACARREREAQTAWSATKAKLLRSPPKPYSLFFRQKPPVILILDVFLEIETHII